MNILLSDIKHCIENQLRREIKSFVIFPYGEIGMKVEEILEKNYGIQPIAIIDNHLCKYNDVINPLSYLNDIKSEYVVLLASTNESIYAELKSNLKKYVSDEKIIELNSMIYKEKYTECGKYSSGPLCDHKLVKSVGTFCSFVLGSDGVSNHAIDYISTHRFLYTCNILDMLNKNMKYDDFQWKIGIFQRLSQKVRHIKEIGLLLEMMYG